MNDPILQTETNGITILTLCSDTTSETKAVLNTHSMHAVQNALNTLPNTQRVVVITGQGGIFADGQSLGVGGTMRDLQMETTLRDTYVPLLQALLECPVPVIAAVNGTAAGTGAALALACDVVIAAPSVVFSYAFSALGLIPDAGATYWLPRHIGLARAMGVALFAPDISAQQAAEWGMIWRVADSDNTFYAEWQQCALQLAAGPSVAYKHIRQALRKGYHHSVQEQWVLEAGAQGACSQSHDFREAILALHENRPPMFKGR